MQHVLLSYKSYKPETHDILSILEFKKSTGTKPTQCTKSWNIAIYNVLLLGGLNILGYNVYSIATKDIKCEGKILLK